MTLKGEAKAISYMLSMTSNNLWVINHLKGEWLD